MNKESTQKIKLGIFVTLGVILLALALYLVGNQRNMFSSRFPLSTHFTEVNGLKKGNNVRFAGIDVGIVKRVTIRNDSTIQVDMLLREEVRSHIRKNAVASIGTDGLVGNVIVNIRAVAGDAPPVIENDRIASAPSVDTDALLSTLSVSNENVATLTQNLVEITDQINSGEGSLGIMLQDDRLAHDLQRTVANLSAASRGAAQTVSELESTAYKINHGSGLISFLAEDTITVGQLRQTMQNLQTASESVVGVTHDLQGMVEEVDAGQGTAGLLVNDTALAQDIQQSVDDIQTGVALFNENMEALQHNFLLRRYFKKQRKKSKLPNVNDQGHSQR